MSSTSTAAATDSGLRGIALSALVVTVISGVVNTLISLGAQALGADAGLVMGLQPVTFLVFTLIGALLGGLGWHLVRRRAADPARTLRWLVPAVVAVSLVPDLLVAVSFSAVGGIALGLMHLVVAGVAVPTYRRFLPLPR
ncbi:DUF6069 family protein [Pseudonocardia sp. CA-107938]|uniref:DUF6069 family protein n=1 Tax=Pseudonocardia sp. CA-107938 TaxID=3240021 RepID=UPI003D93234C